MSQFPEKSINHGRLISTNAISLLSFVRSDLFFTKYRSDLEHLRSVFMAVENGDLGMLKSLGIKDSELGDVKFFLEKLVNTGFLDWVAPERNSPFYYSVPIRPQFYSYLENSLDGYNYWSNNITQQQITEKKRYKKKLYRKKTKNVTNVVHRSKFSGAQVRKEFGMLMALHSQCLYLYPIFRCLSFHIHLHREQLR